MALKYFRGRLDLTKLSLSDLADAAGALATLERLAEHGIIAFESGASRNAGPRPDVAGGRASARPKLQSDILAVLREGGPMNFATLQEATGMKEGSLSANLSLLVRHALIIKTVGERTKGERGRPRRDATTYSLKPEEGGESECPST